MNTTPRLLALVLLALALTACGGGSRDAAAPTAAAETTTTAGTLPPTMCDLTEGSTIPEAEAVWDCTVGGELVAFAGYDDCEDGSSLVVGGDDGDPAAGFVVFPAGGGPGVWRVGPWGPAWETCYGY